MEYINMRVLLDVDEKVRGRICFLSPTSVDDCVSVIAAGCAASFGRNPQKKKKKREENQNQYASATRDTSHKFAAGQSNNTTLARTGFTESS